MNTFTANTMPEHGMPFEVIWLQSDGSEKIYEGDLRVWERYVALYGYPDAPRWRYATPGPHQVTF